MCYNAFKLRNYHSHGNEMHENNEMVTFQYTDFVCMNFHMLTVVLLVFFLPHCKCVCYNFSETPLPRLSEDHLAKSPEEVFDLLGKLGEG